MATKQLLATDLYVVPRVNLLPPEIAAKRAEQKSYAFMGLAVAGAAAAVVALYVGQASKVSAAKQELQESKTESTKLKGERAGLQTVQDVYAAVDADEALLTRALERRVLWSAYLHDLGIRIPENVWVTQLNATVTGHTIVGLTPGVVPTGVGVLTVTGKAFAYNDVAAWLESLTPIKGVVNPYFTSAVKNPPLTPNARAIVTFSSTAVLTDDAITPHKKGGSR